MNKTWKENNTIKSLKEKVLNEAKEMNELDAISYLMNNMEINCDDAYDVYRDIHGLSPKTWDDLEKEAKYISKDMKIASHFDDNGVTVLPESWRE